MLPTHHLTPFSRLPLRNSITEPGAKICAILWDPLSSKRGSKETELCENELLCKVSLSDFWPTERPWDTSVVIKQVWLQYWDEVMFLATWWLLQWPNILVLYNKSTWQIPGQASTSKWGCHFHPIIVKHCVQLCERKSDDEKASSE